MNVIWYCESHPEKEMGHDGCKGAGIPESARIGMLVLQKRLLSQQLKETKQFLGEQIKNLRETLIQQELNKL